MTSSSSAPAGTAWPPPTTLRAITASAMSRCSRRATSAAATPAATRPSSARTTSRPKACKFYDESVRLWHDLSQDFDLNLFYSTRGHFTLAHTDSAMRTMRWRAEVNKHFGVDSEAVDAKSVAAAVPMIDLTCGGHAPMLGRALSRARRHRAPRCGGLGLWPRRRPARRRDPPEDRSHGDRARGSWVGPAVVGVRTNRGRIATRKVLCAVAGSTPRSARDGRACARRSTSIRCRPWCPSRSSPGSIRSSSRDRCMSTSARPRAANW